LFFDIDEIKKGWCDMSLRVVGRLNVFEKDGVERKRIEVWWNKKKRMEIGWCRDGEDLDVYMNGGGKRYEGKLECKGDVKVVERKEDNVEF